MPEGAPLPKIEATTSCGGGISLDGSAVEQTLIRAKELADSSGSVFIHPFEHPDVVAGQGTVGLEIIEQCPGVRTIVVPVGGGGLASGIAVVAKAASPPVRGIGVQGEASAAYPASFAAGHPGAVTPLATMAEGIEVATPGALAFVMLACHASPPGTVSAERPSPA